jgi:molecular chaperone DnaK
MGGVMTKLIEKNTTIPTKASNTFSTADDNQTAVTVHVLQGERERARDNKSLGRFDLAGIPPAPRGVPQVEVSFNIDANGILNVSAKDKATGKAQSIVIKASSGLSDEEVKRMIREAEANAEEDKKFHELVAVRNHADTLIHSVSKSLKEAGDKVTDDEKSHIEAAVEALKEAIKGDDKELIEKRTTELTEASGKMAERMYAQTDTSASSSEAGGSEGHATGGESGEKTTGKAKDDVVDAEFEEVKDENK